MVPPHFRQYGSWLLSAQRSRMKVISTSESLIRTTDPRVSVFAAAERRKCWGISYIRVPIREYAIFRVSCQRESSRICYFMAVDAMEVAWISEKPSGNGQTDRNGS